MDWRDLGGLFPLAGGVYGILVAQGVLPRDPRDPERAMHFRRRFGLLIVMVAPMLIVFGVLRLLGML